VHHLLDPALATLPTRCDGSCLESLKILCRYLPLTANGFRPQSAGSNVAIGRHVVDAELIGRGLKSDRVVRVATRHGQTNFRRDSPK
jgi:hypothetical protein